MHACIGEGNGNHSYILAWRIPGTEEPGGLPSMGSHRVESAIIIHISLPSWALPRPPTHHVITECQAGLPDFYMVTSHEPRESPWTEEPGRRSPWGYKESDTTEQLSIAHSVPRACYTEWSESERENYHILMHIHGTEKNGTDASICRERMEMQM